MFTWDIQLDFRCVWKWTVGQVTFHKWKASTERIFRLGSRILVQLISRIRTYFSGEGDGGVRGEGAIFQIVLNFRLKGKLQYIKFKKTI